MKKSILLGLGACALALGGVAALAGRPIAVTKTDAAVIGSENVYRFTNGGNWDKVYVHAWNGEGGLDTWPGTELKNCSYNEAGQKVYLYVTSDEPTHLIFNNGSGTQTGNIEIGSNKAWYWTGSGDIKAASWQVTSQTYYFYDYENVCAGHAYCYAKMSNGTYANVAEESDAIEMTPVAGTSGQVYSITLDPMFDQVTIRKAGSGDDKRVVTDLYVNHNRGRVYSTKKFSDSNWVDLNNVIADDWIFNYMHLRDIDVDPEDGDTGACKSSGSNYYALAKAALQAYDPSIVSIITSYGKYYTDAYARLQAWATANREVINIDGTTVTVTASKLMLPGFTNETDSSLPLMIAITSVSAILAGAGLVFFRKRKAE